MRSARAIFLWLLWQLSAGSGKVKIGEKTIGNWRKVGRILELFPKAKFIHIYRDPRDVVVSLKGQHWWTASSAMPAAMYCRQVLGELKEREQLAEQIKWGLKCFLIGGSRKFISEKPVSERLSGRSDRCCNSDRAKD